MLCPVCKTANPEYAKLCCECGHRIAQGISSPELTVSGDRTVDANPRGGNTNAEVAIESTYSGQNTVLPGGAAKQGATEPTPGMIVGEHGRYRIDAKVGQGGMGVVYSATDQKLDRTVALKRLLSADAAGEAAIARFDTEAKSIAALSHANIVAVYDYGHDDDGPYLVMEFVKGEPLDAKLKTGRLDEEDALRIFEGMCRGVAYAHRNNIIHRDLKPANVMVDEDGTARLLDFGLARGAAGMELSLSGYGMGTLDYAAPEQKRDAKSADQRADIYSLGATFYELLTGLKPVPLHIAKAPTRWQDVISKACEPSPLERYQTVEELLNELQAGKTSGHFEPVEPEFAVAVPRGHVCVSCGESITGNSRYCPGCGAGLLIPCPVCSGQVHAGKSFCDQCGTGVEHLSAIARTAEMAKLAAGKGSLDKASQLLEEALKAISGGAQVGDPAGMSRWLQEKKAEVDAPREKALDLLFRAESAEREGNAAVALEHFRQAALLDKNLAKPAKDAEVRLVGEARSQWAKSIKQQVINLVNEKKFEDAIELLESNVKEIPSLLSTLQKCQTTFPARIKRRDARELVARARNLEKARDFEGALKTLEQAVGLDPKQAAVLSQARQSFPARIRQRDIQQSASKGMAALHQGDLHGAQSELEKLSAALGRDAGRDSRYVQLVLGLKKAGQRGREKRVAAVTVAVIVAVLVVGGLAYVAFSGNSRQSTDGENLSAAGQDDSERQQSEKRPGANGSAPKDSGNLPGVKADAKSAQQKLINERYAAVMSALNDGELTGALTEQLGSDAYELALPLAESGNLKAQAVVGMCHMAGVGTSADDASALKWFKAAADEGDPIASFMVYLFFTIDHETGYTESQIETMLLDSASKGLVVSWHMAGIAAYEGSLGKVSVATAIQRYSKAAEAGFPPSQFTLGVLLLTEKAPHGNPTEGVDWLKTAAENGHGGAQLRLGLCLRDGEGAKQDLSASEYWLKKAAFQKIEGANEALTPVSDYLRQMQTPKPRPGFETSRSAPVRVSKNVHAALDWLSSHQAKDGHWSAAGFSADSRRINATKTHNVGFLYKNDPEGDTGWADTADVGVTALSLLAFTSAGCHHTSGENSFCCYMALRYLLSTQTPGGLFGSNEDDHAVYNHAISTVALAELYGMTGDPSMVTPLNRAVSFILDLQNPGMGWRYDKRSRRSDTSVTGWMVLALKSSMAAGITVDTTKSFTGAAEWLRSVTTEVDGAPKCGYDAAGSQNARLKSAQEYHHNPAMDAVYISSMLAMGAADSSDSVIADMSRKFTSSSNLPEWAERRVDFYYWYYASLATYQLGGSTWSRWNSVVEKVLTSEQRGYNSYDSQFTSIVLDEHGSWDPVGAWGSAGGRVMSTAFGVLILCTPNRYPRWSDTNSATEPAERSVATALNEIEASKSFKEAFAAALKYRGTESWPVVDEALQARLGKLDKEEYTKLILMDALGKINSKSSMEDIARVMSGYRTYLRYQKCRHRVEAESKIKELDRLLEPKLRDPANYNSGFHSVIELSDPRTCRVASASAESNRVAIQGLSRLVIVDLATRQTLKAFDVQYNSCFSISADGKTVGWVTNDGQAKVMNLDTNEVMTFEMSQPSAMALSEDGKKVIIAGYGKIETRNGHCASVYSVSNGRELSRTEGHHRARITSVGFLGTLKFFTFDVPNQTIGTWSSSTGKTAKLLGGQKYHMDDVVASPDGKWLLAREDKTIRAFKVSSGEQEFELAVSEVDLSAIAVSPDSDYVVVGSKTGQVKVISIDERKEINQFSASNEAVLCVQFGMDQHALISLSQSKLNWWTADLPDE